MFQATIYRPHTNKVLLPRERQPCSVLPQAKAKTSLAFGFGFWVWGWEPFSHVIPGFPEFCQIGNPRPSLGFGFGFWLLGLAFEFGFWVASTCLASNTKWHHWQPHQHRTVQNGIMNNCINIFLYRLQHRSIDNCIITASLSTNWVYEQPHPPFLVVHKRSSSATASTSLPRQLQLTLSTIASTSYLVEYKM